jgi:uncharacterized protein (DUF169 family)
MAGLGYLRMDEAPGMARLPRTPGAVVYPPRAKTPVDLDAVLFAGRPGRLMLLQEAAMRAGVPVTRPQLAGPACMAIPAALEGGVVASSACVGNRVYTEAGDDRLYVVVPGKEIARVAGEIETIAAANTKLAEYHRAQMESLRSE